jgi:hypothetical protein
MRLSIPCMQCLNERLQENGLPDGTLYPAELQESGAYAIRCRFDHSTITLLQEQKFELLAELAANALLDGYPREAVLSMAAAVERFQEFYIRVIASEKGIETAPFDAAWKPMSQLSERQLGAYIMLYTMETRRPPPILTDRTKQIRNEVAHKGVIPSREKAIEFGDAALAVIHPVLHELRASHAEHVQRLVWQHFAGLTRDIDSGVPRATMAFPTIISLSRPIGDAPPSLSPWIENLRRRRAKSGW